MKTFLKISLLLIILTISASAQANLEVIKREAISHMEAEQYGEAIDLLNKYVTSKARDAEGYNLRGLCFEKREVYQFAVLDFRRAVRLEPSNDEFRKNLQRARATWDKILYKKIEGYKREIAIDPSNPFNYLGVGLSYRWLEDWAMAEIWYDKYLAMDPDASPDEIIRYTEILSHTGSIKKGEIKLAEWVKKHPEDWRLWSRYGYFTMWVGNYPNAKKAFNKALSYKPYFKEAQDGLDRAERKGYMTKYSPRSFEREYPIDRSYRLLKSDPENNKLRYDLAKQLIAENRLEEAHAQLTRLQDVYGDSTEFTELLDSLETVRDSLYENQVEYYKNIVSENPQDKEASIKLAENYARLYYFDEAIEVLKNYVENYATDEDTDIKYMLARYSAWNYEWDTAVEYSKLILDQEPENLEYQLLRAQIAVWTVQDLEEGRELLENILENQPENVLAHLTLVNVLLWQKDFDLAKEHLERAKSIDPSSPEVEAAESNFAIHLSAHEELEIVKIKSEAGELAEEGDCQAAVEKYDEYLAQITGPNREEKLEYADFNVCAENYDKALEIYNQMLRDDFEDFDVKLRRGKVFYWMKDTVAVLDVFEELNKEEPDNYEIEMFLGHALMLNKRYEKAINVYDSAVKKINNPDVEEILFQSKFIAKLSIGDAYQEMGEYGQAEDLYYGMLEETEDSAEINMIKQRIDWLPEYGAGIFFEDIFAALLPNYMGLSPVVSFYTDNQDLYYYQYGGRLTIGLNNYMAVGGEWLRTKIHSDNLMGKPGTQTGISGEREFTEMKAVGQINYQTDFVLSGHFGQMKTNFEPLKHVWGGNLKIALSKNLEFYAQYRHTDARLMLYSPFLLNERTDVDYYGVTTKYKHKDLFKLMLSYNYMDILNNKDDGGLLIQDNNGNNFNAKIGKQFVDSLYIGYEFQFSDFGYTTTKYYSPQNYEAHSIWAEYTYYPQEELKLILSGSLGYAPKVDYVLRNISAEAIYTPSDLIQLSLKLGAGSSYRYESTYNYFSGQFSAYISI